MGGHLANFFFFSLVGECPESIASLLFSRGAMVSFFSLFLSLSLGDTLYLRLGTRAAPRGGICMRTGRGGLGQDERGNGYIRHGEDQRPVTAGSRRDSMRMMTPYQHQGSVDGAFQPLSSRPLGVWGLPSSAGYKRAFSPVRREIKKQTPGQDASIRPHLRKPTHT